MEGGLAEKKSSYTYWVREATEEAAPLPVPRKLSADDLSRQPRTATLGSVWNQAGTWEERNLNSWANNRIKELLKSLGSLEFSSGKAYIDEVLKCSGDDVKVDKSYREKNEFEMFVQGPGENFLSLSSQQQLQHAQYLNFELLKEGCFCGFFYSCKTAFLVTVRNKKRVGYTFELTLKFKGEWLMQKENKKIKGHLDIPEFSFGELEDLQIEVRLSEDKEVTREDKMQIHNDLRLFLTPIREKLKVFEQELKDM